MSTKYPGGFITKSPVAPTTAAASGVWTLDQQQQYQKAGTWPAPPNYIEEVFSTYLYTGNNSTQTITNGIDLASEGGLVWTKVRSTTDDHELIDTVRGRAFSVESNTTDAQSTSSVGTSLTQFNSNGYSLGTNGSANVNENAQTFVSWTFRKQPKFFDVVTWTGTGSATTIAHNLGSTPGCIIVKAYAVSGYGWRVYHSYLGATQYLSLEVTSAATTSSTTWNNTAPTSTNFTVGTDVRVNEAGVNYIAYVFASNAGGFGLTGTDNVITCGSFTTDSGGGATVTLGYEPQWVMIKRSDGTSNWFVVDTMRGFPVDVSGDQLLYANAANAEANIALAGITSTGFIVSAATSATYIYIAIRRGPMKVPTSGTSVFNPNTTTNDTVISTTGFPVDLCIEDIRTPSSYPEAFDRLRGSGIRLLTSSTDAEGNTGTNPQFQSNTGVTPGRNGAGVSCILWNFQRAPSFFDEVCFTQSDYTQAYTHNLTVVPEMMIVKRRNNTSDWSVYSAALGNTKYLKLQDTGGEFTGGVWGNTSPTSTQFTFSGAGSPNTYVAYLFATCAGVSKVGSYTGTGALLTVDCGFTSGARFVLIKRTDSTGDWYTYDSARGITSGNDPYLLLNSTAAEVTGTNYVDTDTTGFKVTAAAPAGLNASGGTYIFLAIA